ncbi:type I-C CRISPR-associated protein Cas8c/Csd1 [Acuticoccus sediminis]|uniref:Type I-C CRISPR-associated protein Cas8c/Csd1 n=1 Tax=Acuticoccus sediminis TaxID=2184697 RepID=A0A8B2NES8_9HYPH|nr:type I-C CRISPR-associated protein Cas8c/Csd1 [Acuticoccus sediminis]RAH95918.1 type I-C CRISPR-associated protein Cas8c/Csd1 [Acuticoccus sediminis]
MTILAALTAATLPDAPPPGFAEGKVSTLVSLNPDGTVANVTDLRIHKGSKRVARVMLIPHPVKRASGIAPNFLWDKTAYALGVTAGAGKRTADEHAAFVALHEERLAGTEDEGLKALLAFLRTWSPERFSKPIWADTALDENVVFALETDRQNDVRLHDRPAARALLAQTEEPGETAAICLVTGIRAPPARLHPSIKGVWGGQTAGGSIVSFNLDAFESYGHKQGDNAPVSEEAAFAYTGALNRFLATDSGHRIQIGDASTVFWAEADDGATAATATGLFAQAFGSTPDTRIDVQRVGAVLAEIQRGKPIAEVAPDLAEGVRFYVLGLAPNAARISIRFWLEDDFAALMHNYAEFAADICIDPPSKDGQPPLWRYLLELAVQGKRENVPPNLAGEVMRSILTGGRYPQSLLATTLMRIRTDRRVGPLRAGLVKAFLTRNHFGSPPVARDVDNPSTAYQLGRLFAVLEAAQYAALGRVNAPISDRYYAAASATPARVFSALMRGLHTHVSHARKRGRGGWIEPRIEEIMSKLDPDLPKTLQLEDQGRFALGYYHEKSYRPAGTAALSDDEIAEGDAQ